MTGPTQAAERRAPAMGSTLHVMVVADEPVAERLATWAVRRVGVLEGRWSRFLPASEVSRLNSRAGSPVRVSEDTLTLVARALEARTLSRGRFDPTMLGALHANGYDRTFAAIRLPVVVQDAVLTTVTGAVHVDRPNGTVELGANVGFDPGGIGKGLAADMVAEELIDRGARGALVNVGGDLRCLGTAPDGHAWVIACGDTVAGVENVVVELREGGVATSTCRRRRWARRGPSGLTEAHHLLDATTGLSTDRAAHAPTVISATAADSEWLATSVAADGVLPSDAVRGNAAILLNTATGEQLRAGQPEAFLR